MIGLSSSYFALKGFSIFESVSRIIELGFDVVEIGAAHNYEENIWEKLKEIRRQFPNKMFLLHTLFPPLEEKIWFNPAEGLTKRNILIVDNLIRSALLLESPLISIHPPVLNTVEIDKKKLPNGFLSLNLSEKFDFGPAKNNFFELIKYVDIKAAQNNLIVCIENLDCNYFDAVFSSSNDFVEIFNRFKNIAMLLDVGHALLSSQLNDLIELNGHIRELHLHGIMVSNEEKHGHHLISDAAYFEPIKELLSDASIPVVFEHGSHVSEDDILREKELLENYVAAKENK